MLETNIVVEIKVGNAFETSIGVPHILITGNLGSREAISLGEIEADVAELAVSGNFSHSLAMRNRRQLAVDVDFIITVQTNETDIYVGLVLFAKLNVLGETAETFAGQIESIFACRTLIGIVDK